MFFDIVRDFISVSKLKLLRHSEPSWALILLKREAWALLLLEPAASVWHLRLDVRELGYSVSLFRSIVSRNNRRGHKTRLRNVQVLSFLFGANLREVSALCLNLEAIEVLLIGFSLFLSLDLIHFSLDGADFCQLGVVSASDFNLLDSSHNLVISNSQDLQLVQLQIECKIDWNLPLCISDIIQYNLQMTIFSHQL